MTWTYKVTDAGNLSVYDHTDTHIKTVMNDGSGVTLPDDVLDVMKDEAIEEYGANGWSDRLLAIMRDAMFEQIEDRDA